MGENNTSPLTFAVGSSSIDEKMITVLIEAGADPNYATQAGTPIMAAGSVSKLRRLVKGGADVNKEVEWQKHQHIPLAKFVFDLNEEMVGELVKFGADPLMVSTHGLTLFHNVVETTDDFVCDSSTAPRFVSMVKKLLKLGVDINRSDKRGLGLCQDTEPRVIGRHIESFRGEVLISYYLLLL